MQPSINSFGLGIIDAERLAETGGEIPGTLALAVKAGAVAGGERRHLVEEEKLGPAGIAARGVASHDLAPPPTKVAHADQPGLGCPTALEQRLRVGIVDDATVSREQATRFDRVDLAERIDAVLQWHIRSSLCVGYGA